MSSTLPSTAGASSASIDPSQRKIMLMEQHARLRAMGFDASKAGVLLLPMLGPNSSPLVVVQAAQTALAQGLTDSMIKDGVHLAGIRTLVACGREGNDWTPLVRCIGKTFSKPDVMGKSFLRRLSTPAVPRPTSASVSSSQQHLQQSDSMVLSRSASLEDPSAVGNNSSLTSNNINNESSRSFKFPRTNSIDAAGGGGGGKEMETGTDPMSSSLSSSSTSSSSTTPADVRLPAASPSSTLPPISNTPLHTFRNSNTTPAVVTMGTLLGSNVSSSSSTTTLSSGAASAANVEIPTMVLDSTSPTLNSMVVEGGVPTISPSGSEMMTTESTPSALSLDTTTSSSLLLSTTMTTLANTTSSSTSENTIGAGGSSSASSSINSSNSNNNNNGAEDTQKSSPTVVSVDAGAPELMVCPIDVESMLRAYDLIVKATSASESVSNSLLHASIALSTELSRTASRWELPSSPSSSSSSSSSSSPTAYEGLQNLRALFVLASNPCLEFPEYHERVIKNLCRTYVAAHDSYKHMLQHWIATADGSNFKSTTQATGSVVAPLLPTSRLSISSSLSSSSSSAVIHTSGDVATSSSGAGTGSLSSSSSVSLSAAEKIDSTRASATTNLTSKDADSTLSATSSSSSSSSSSSATVSSTPLTSLLIKRNIDWVQQFITILLCSAVSVSTGDISDPVAWLGMLNAANEAVFAATAERPVPFKDFYNQMISEEINLEHDHVRWARARTASRNSSSSSSSSSTSSSSSSATPPIFSFCAHPFILDAAAKAKVLEVDGKVQMEAEARNSALRVMFGGFLGGGMPQALEESDVRFNLRVRRDHLLEDALRGIVQTGRRDNLKKPLKVVFVGEEGLDAGGVRKEFFTLITRQLFDAEFGMFTENAETRMLFFRPDSMEPPLNFELIGSLIGLAIYNAVILDLALPLVLYRKLKHEPLGLRDLDDWQPTLARSLRQLLAYEDDDFADVFALTFSVDTESFGETKTIDLIPNGSNIPVTRENVREYVRSYLQWLLVGSVEPFFSSFERGFKAVVGGPALELFRPEELAESVRGSLELNFEELERATRYEAPYKASHTVIKNLWMIVHAFTDEEKKRFLHFCTGTDRAPLRGLGSIPFIVGREPDSDRLPTSHTCFNHLIIPEYTTFEKLESKLRSAIAQSEGFGLI